MNPRSITAPYTPTQRVRLWAICMSYRLIRRLRAWYESMLGFPVCAGCDAHARSDEEALRHGWRIDYVEPPSFRLAWVCWACLECARRERGG